ncbi:MAG: hypothetical protein ABIP94_11685 [Planctomycetota bacterium]
MPTPTSSQSLRVVSTLLLCLVAVGGARLPAQLIPKALPRLDIPPTKPGEAARPTPAQPTQPTQPTRPTGTWQGMASEPIEGGQNVQYPITMRFTGSDTELRLEVQATTKMPTQPGQSVTLQIAASYLGTFRAGQLRMRSDRIEVRVVETGELVPSSPQQVEGKLQDGVVSGRVGDDAGGWTTFTARPGSPEERAAAEPAEPAAPPAALRFEGRWRGTCREQGPNGELNYPIVVQFTGRGDDLRAEVSADLDYPTQGGRTTPVEYRATFRGSATGAQMTLRSQDIRIRLTELNRNESGPQQELTGRIEQGVLRARIGTGVQSDSVLELRPEGGAPPSGPTSDQRSDRPGEREQVGQEQQRGEVGQREQPRRGEKPGYGGQREPTATGPSPYTTLVLQRQEVRDPAMNNIVSHTLLVPKGWTFAGGPLWTRNLDSFVHFVASVTGPDRESLQFDRSRQFSYKTTSSQLGQSNENNGQEMPDGSIARQPPRAPGEAAVEVILRELRPRASGMRLVDAARQPPLEDKVRKLHAPTLSILEQVSKTTLDGGTQSSVWLVVERARVRYEEDGMQWEEEVRCTMIGLHGSVRSEVMSIESGAWSLSDVTTARAPAGQLDARLPTLWTLAGGLQQTPRWNAAVAEIRLAIGEAQLASQRATLAEIKKRGELLAQSQAELSDQRMQSWRSQQDSLDRVHRATIESIRGVNDFRDPDGNVRTVTNLYDRAFVDPNGNLILTSDPNYRPGGDPSVNQVRWDEMQRIDPLQLEGR